MTNRAGQPDTEADIGVRTNLDQEPPNCFVMIAGAGSGKTTSLVKALAHLSRTKALALRRRGQKIACITYTEVAVGEIWTDVGNDALFHVSTIHSFLWTVVHPFQEDLCQWVAGRIGEKILEAQAKLGNPKTRANTKEKARRDIERYERQREALGSVVRFRYGTGSDYENGVLGHDDILKVGPFLIEQRTLLRTLVARTFPFVFVDESQDTNPAFVDALKLIANTVGVDFCLGFFGDPMQKIYTAGAGDIELGEGWNEITKTENFRCPQRVLDVANRIRSEDDGIQQVRGRMMERADELEPVEGTARLFILSADDRRTPRVAQVRQWLANTNGDDLWLSDDHKADVRVLVLVHRMAARRLGFTNLYAALNDHDSHQLKDGLLDGTAWVVQPFLAFLLPLTMAARADAGFDVMANLRRHCPLLAERDLAGRDVPELLRQLQQDVTQLLTMFEDGSGNTIRQVLEFVRDRGLTRLDDDFQDYLDNEEVDQEENQNAEARSVNAFLDCTADELWGYRTYIEEQSPFATQQGIKGAEFDRVLVVLDDEEAKYNLFSYGKYFGTTELSNMDRTNIANGTDSVVDRTRRLFYVCCSRAVRDLAVILFVHDVVSTRAALERKAFFRAEDTYLLADIEPAAA